MSRALNGVASVMKETITTGNRINDFIRGSLTIAFNLIRSGNAKDANSASSLWSTVN
jgi:hypothetical protein